MVRAVEAHHQREPPRRRALGRAVPGPGAARRATSVGAAPARAHRRAARRTSPATSRPTSPGCSPSGATYRRPAAPCPATSRCCSPAPRRRGAGPRRARAAGVPAVDRRRRQRLRHAAPRGDWLTLLEALEQPHRTGPGPGGRADLVLRGTTPRARSTPAATTSPTRSPNACALGRAASRRAASPRCSRRCRRRAAARVLPGSTASGGSPTCATSARRCTRPPAASGSAWSRCSSWLREERREAGSTATERTRRLDTDAAAVQLVTIHAQQGPPVPGRLPARLFDRYVARRRRPLFHDDDGTPLPRRRRGRPGGRPAGRGRGGGRRGAAAAVRRAHPRPVARSSPGGRRPGTPPDSPLHRLLFGATPGRRAASPTGLAVPTDDEALAASTGGSGRGVRRSRQPSVGPTPVRCLAPSRPGPARRALASTAERRHRLAAHLLLRADPRPRSKLVASAVERARGARHRRRGPGRRGPPPAAAPVEQARLGDRTCRRRWPTCRPARRSARWCTPSSSTPTRGPPRPARRAARHDRRAASLVAGRRSTRGAGRRAGRRLRHLARPARRRRDAAPTIGPRDRLRELDFELPLAGGDDLAARRRPAGRARATSPRCCAATCRPSDPLRAYADAARTRARRPVAARLPHRLDRRGAARARPGPARYLVVDYKTNWLGDPPSDRCTRADDYTPATAGRRRWPTPTTRCRRCSTPSCCTASCAGGSPATTPSGTSAACSTSTCAACAARTPRVVDGSRAASSPGGRRSRWSSRSPTCSTGVPEGGAVMTDRVATALRCRRRTTDRLAPARRRAAGATSTTPACSTSADVHVATRLGALGGETDERVLLAVALAVRAVRRGSVCLDLATVADAPPRPLARPAARRAGRTAGRRRCADRRRRASCAWSDGLLYLDRYSARGGQVVPRPASACRTQPPPTVDGTPPDASRAPVPASRPGRTTASSGAAAAPAPPVDDGAHRRPRHRQDHDGRPAARCSLEQQPTDAGRCGSRCRADRQGRGPAPGVAWTRGRDLPDDADRDRRRRPARRRRCTDCSAGGPTRHPLPRTTGSNRLPYDVVVVDETSMVSLTMMARLLEAVRPDARLVLVGDPDQLASVEAGAVLADLVEGFAAREIDLGRPTRWSR